MNGEAQNTRIKRKLAGWSTCAYTHGRRQTRPHTDARAAACNLTNTHTHTRPCATLTDTLAPTSIATRRYTHYWHRIHICSRAEQITPKIIQDSANSSFSELVHQGPGGPIRSHEQATGTGHLRHNNPMKRFSGTGVALVPYCSVPQFCNTLQSAEHI